MRVTSAFHILDRTRAANTFLCNFSNAICILSEGQSLSGLPSNSHDFVFSYLVLQHFPSTELVAGAIQEMIRTLKPGGVISSNSRVFFGRT
jgi:ubiquinone/menaquinone biosynthesis C-methylase UbiE